MTLPSSPPLSLTQILTELGRLEAGQSLSGAADERALSDRASGSINFSDYLGKSVTPPYNATIELVGSLPANTGSISLGTSVAGRRILVLGFLANSASFSPGQPDWTGMNGGSIIDHDTTGNGSARANGIVAWFGNPSGTSGQVGVTWSQPIGVAMTGWLSFKLVNFGSVRAVNVSAYSHSSNTTINAAAAGGKFFSVVYPSDVSISSGVTTRGGTTFNDSPENHRVVYGWDVNTSAGNIAPIIGGPNAGNGGTVFAGITFNKA